MSVRLCDNSKIGVFDFFYFFLIVFYMAQMTTATSRMIAVLSAPYFPFLLPFVLTIVMAFKHRVNFGDKRLLLLILICFVWELAVTYSKKLYSLSEQSYQFFLFYALVVAFVQVRSVGKQIVPIYESIIVTLCKLSLPFWAVSLILPGPMHAVAGLFPETNLGNNILFLFNYIDPSKADPGQYLRNSGCSWEPGRFSVMITLGLFCNLQRNGVKFKGNYNALWMIVTLLSTMSTTGYSVVIAMYAITILKKSTPVAKFGYSVILIPLVVYLFSLDFMGNKIKGQLDVEQFGEEKLESIDYYQQRSQEEDYLGSLDRFESMFFEWQNAIHAPLLGYGRNPANSYFIEHYGMNFMLTGGLVKVLGMHGFLLGLLFYVLLLRSSRRFSSLFGGTTKGMLFITIALSSISYSIFTVPIFTAFWLYEWFEDKKEQEEDDSEDEEAVDLSED